MWKIGPEDKSASRKSKKGISMKDGVNLYQSEMEVKIETKEQIQGTFSRQRPQDLLIERVEAKKENKE